MDGEVRGAPVGQQLQEGRPDPERPARYAPPTTAAVAAYAIDSSPPSPSPTAKSLKLELNELNCTSMCLSEPSLHPLGIDQPLRRAAAPAVYLGN